MDRVYKIVSTPLFTKSSRFDSGYRYEFFQANKIKIKIVARTREKIDFLRKNGENTKPWRYGAG